MKKSLVQLKPIFILSSTRNPVLGTYSITTTATPDEYEFKIIEGSRELFHYKHAGITTKTTYIQPPQYSVHLMAKR